MLVTGKVTTLSELQTVYSVEDAYNLLEMDTVAKYNEAILRGDNS